MCLYLPHQTKRLVCVTLKKMKTTINILLLILIFAVVISILIEPLTTTIFFAGSYIMITATVSFLILNKKK